MKPKPEGLLTAATLSLIVGLLIASCGKNPTDASAVPSPQPSATPTPAPKLTVIVKVVGLQNGVVVERVAADTDFKINGTATVCYLDGEPTKCPTIPFWIQRQTGGPPCRKGGDDNSGSILYNCHEVGVDLTFEACAANFDHVEIGCGDWTMLEVFKRLGGRF